MEKLFEKIDSYNIFNYLVPGAVIFEFLRAFGSIPNVSDILSRLVLYYFVGLTASRIGSILFEPLLETLGIIKKSDYKKYVKACTKDTKIELFVEIANMYRTFYVGAIVCLIATFLPHQHVFDFNIFLTRLALFAAIALFFVSYRKQSGYINKRVEMQSK